MTADPYAVTVIILSPGETFGDLADAARRSNGIAEGEPVDLCDVLAEAVTP
jgi:hypothetical protein